MRAKVNWTLDRIACMFDCPNVVSNVAISLSNIEPHNLGRIHRTNLT